MSNFLGSVHCGDTPQRPALLVIPAPFLVILALFHCHPRAGGDPLFSCRASFLINLSLDVYLPSLIIMTARLNLVAESTKSPRPRRHNSLIRVAFGSRTHDLRLFTRETHISVKKQMNGSG